MNPQLNKRLHFLINDLEMDQVAKSERVAYWTNGRTMSSKEMTDGQAESMIGDLSSIHRERVKKLRAKCVKCLADLGYKNGLGNMDWPRINNYIENIGTRNPKRQSLNQMSCKTLRAVAVQLAQRLKVENQTHA